MSAAVVALPEFPERLTANRKLRAIEPVVLRVELGPDSDMCPDAVTNASAGNYDGGHSAHA